MVFAARSTRWAPKPRYQVLLRDDDAGCHALMQAINSYWNLAYNIGAVTGLLGGATAHRAILLGKTLVPQMAVVANPAALSCCSPAGRPSPSTMAHLAGGFFTILRSQFSS